MRWHMLVREFPSDDGLGENGIRGGDARGDGEGGDKVVAGEDGPDEEGGDEPAPLLAFINSVFSEAGEK